MIKWLKIQAKEKKSDTSYYQIRLPLVATHDKDNFVWVISSPERFKHYTDVFYVCHRVAAPQTIRYTVEV
jgi:hypothetical protein